MSRRVDASELSAPSVARYDRARQRTGLGYPRISCRPCGCRLNKRIATLFVNLRYVADIVFLEVLWRLRQKLSLCDVAELPLKRGFAGTRETIPEWEFRFAPLLAD